MAKDLRSSGFDNVIVKPLEDDLKYYNTEQIRRCFMIEKQMLRLMLVKHSIQNTKALYHFIKYLQEI